MIQARTGSTRLPSKILRPFCGEDRIIDILLRNIKRSCPDTTVVLATTVAPADDALEQVARLHGVGCFRGSEQDVLARFIGAADAFGLDRVIRVCSDNPFMMTDSFAGMFAAHDRVGGDYIGYRFPDGRPVIKSHLGLFGELATADALKKASRLSPDPFMHEHVTIFLYTHPELFGLRWLELPDELRTRQDLRLTLDTPQDFALLSELWQKYSVLKEPTMERLIELVDGNPEYGRIMKQNILQNEK